MSLKNKQCSKCAGKEARIESLERLINEMPSEYQRACAERDMWIRINQSNVELLKQGISAIHPEERRRWIDDVRVYLSCKN